MIETNKFITDNGLPSCADVDAQCLFLQPTMFNMYCKICNHEVLKVEGTERIVPSSKCPIWA